ncbi:unnamed protein product [Meloidogyne enterolobii]|uniref:Uncharacterized protein n=1 Tax=Meloidogyne enterolobii TaxID=390850 RepID=A0ACB0ZL31_MELEN
MPMELADAVMKLVLEGACQELEEDGRCVSQCTGTQRYNRKQKINELIPKSKAKYAYEKHCLPECPPGTLIESSSCVARCSPGFYRDPRIDPRKCIPCKEKECPVVCQFPPPGVDILNSGNIHVLENCTEVEGYITIIDQSYVEISQFADEKEFIRFEQAEVQPKSQKLFAPLNASQLEILKSIKIITGFLAIEGSNFKNPLRPSNLSFLENLELIEGRQLFFEKYALLIFGDPQLKWLGLRSLSNITHGNVFVRNNSNLCYSQSIPFKQIFGINQSFWINNGNETDCGNFSRFLMSTNCIVAKCLLTKCPVTKYLVTKNQHQCDQNCAKEFGCWGPGPEQCVKCKKYLREKECLDKCPDQGYFVDNSKPLICQPCNDQCKICHGPLPTQCSICKTYHIWILQNSINNTSNSIEYYFDEFDENEFITTTTPKEQIADGSWTIGAVKKCVQYCPNSTTYSLGFECRPCHEACFDGCTGPGDIVGNNGCNKCLYGLKDELGNLRCLKGNEPSSDVCGFKNTLGENYFLALEPANSLTKFSCRKCRPECKNCTRDGVVEMASDGSTPVCNCAYWRLEPAIVNNNRPTECSMDCGKGSYVLKYPNETLSGIGECRRCHPFCDIHRSCYDDGPSNCEKCAHGGIVDKNGTVTCLNACPPELPYADEEGICQLIDRERSRRQKQIKIVGGVFLAIILLAVLIGFLVWRCLIYQKKYMKEVQMHLPEIPPLDPLKVTQRPNMRRLNLIQVNELDFLPGKSTVLGQGAFGIVYAGKWRPPGVKVNIPVAIKAISALDSRLNEKEMLREAGIMHSVQHEHLLPVAGICLGGGGGLKIVTLLRPLGSLLKFFEQYSSQLGSKQLMLYCYQISSAMEYLTKRAIVHRDLAARNVLVKSALHVEVTDFGLATMLQRPNDSVIIEGRVAVKWLAPESLRHSIFNQRTDVWSFGITCWEILTVGACSPYKELKLPRERLARELVDKLECGYRLEQPNNCSQELYQELLNCWLPDPESRPSFRQIKERFEQFCRAPHIYIQERRNRLIENQQKQQQMESRIGSIGQREMIARLLHDSDFADPVFVDPAEYSNNSLNNRDVINTNSPQRENTNNTNTTILSDDDCFFSTVELVNNNNKTPSPRNCGVKPDRHGSVATTISSRYKSDPLGSGSRKCSHSSWSRDEDGPLPKLSLTDEDNYLMPIKKLGLFLDEEIEKFGEEDEEEDNDDDENATLYTPVVEGKRDTIKKLFPSTLPYSNTTTLYTNQFGEYINEKNGEEEKKNVVGVIKGSGNIEKDEKKGGYVNTKGEEEVMTAVNNKNINNNYEDNNNLIEKRDNNNQLLLRTETETVI